MPKLEVDDSVRGKHDDNSHRGDNRSNCANDNARGERQVRGLPKEAMSKLVTASPLSGDVCCVFATHRAVLQGKDTCDSVLPASSQGVNKNSNSS